MRADELVVLSVAEYKELKAKADRGAASSELFNAEEMQAIREQYVERVEAAEARRDELEWKLRMELAKIRDAELSSRRAADEMRRIEITLQALLTDEEDDTQVRSTVPSRRLQPEAAKPQASIALKPAILPPPLPPPLPSMDEPRNGNSGGTQAEKFQRAMANRKRYVA